MFKKFSAILCLSFWSVSAYGLDYRITDLGILSGSSNISRAHDINNQQQIVGSSGNLSGSGIKAFFWDASSGMTELSGLSGSTHTSALGINNSGEIVGYSVISTGTHAVLWDSAHNIIDLGVYPGESISQAFAINDSQLIAGRGRVGSNDQAFIWENTVLTPIGPDVPGPSQYSYALDVNNLNEVVGLIHQNDGVTRAMYWENENTTLLNSLAGGTDMSIASAINDNDQIVGLSNASAGDRATLWNENAVIDLGSLAAAPDRSGAYDINDMGVIVGWSGTGSGTSDKAVMWDSNHEIHDLSLLLSTNDPLYGMVDLQGANAINTSGQIVGWGYINGDNHAFLLNPVPVPAAVWLFGSGLIGLIGIARRKKS